MILINMWYFIILCLPVQGFNPDLTFLEQKTGFSKKCYCAKKSIILPSPANSFQPRSFAHFPHSFPHLYVNFSTYKKCSFFSHFSSWLWGKAGANAPAFPQQHKIPKVWNSSLLRAPALLQNAQPCSLPLSASGEQKLLPDVRDWHHPTGKLRKFFQKLCCKAKILPLMHG